MTRWHAIPGLILAALLVAGTVRAQETKSQLLRFGHGLAVAVPTDWEPEDASGTYEDWDAEELDRVRVTCISDGCQRTREACTFNLRDEAVAGADDAERLSSLYDSALKRYSRIRAVLKSTGAGATIRSPLATTEIGGRLWWVIETQASPGFKSGLYAETVIGGRYVGAICKTCETEDLRHVAARSMLSSLRGEDGGS